MILIISGKISGSTDTLMELLEERKIPAFRFNLDMFSNYRFWWKNDDFIIEDKTGRICKSEELTAMVFYKGTLMFEQPFENEDKYAPEQKWVVSTLNQIYRCLMCFGMEHGLLHLWHPHEHHFAKTLQMKIAKKYFAVPDFYLYWNHTLQQDNVIVKSLTQRPLSSGEMMYAKIVSPTNLDPLWPWFCQNVAEGDRDATVVYINGKVYCYQFATERDDLTDWRITQGTDANKWIHWNAGKEFEEKIDSYMKELRLKYGRLDFIIGGKEPQFLEVNPAGQFGWLDDENLTLHNEVVDAILDPSSTITL